MPDRGKPRNTALALSVFGAIFMVPPLINIFNQPVWVFEVPLIGVYLFVLWIILILGTFFLSRHLREVEPLTKSRGGDEGSTNIGAIDGEEGKD